MGAGGLMAGVEPRTYTLHDARGAWSPQNKDKKRYRTAKKWDRRTTKDDGCLVRPSSFVGSVTCGFPSKKQRDVENSRGIEARKVCGLSGSGGRGDLYIERGKHSKRGGPHTMKKSPVAGTSTGRRPEETQGMPPAALGQADAARIAGYRAYLDFYNGYLL